MFFSFVCVISTSAASLSFPVLTDHPILLPSPHAAVARHCFFKLPLQSWGTAFRLLCNFSTQARHSFVPSGPGGAVSVNALCAIALPVAPWAAVHLFFRPLSGLRSQLSLQFLGDSQLSLWFIYGQRLRSASSLLCPPPGPRCRFSLNHPGSSSFFGVMHLLCWTLRR